MRRSFRQSVRQRCFWRCMYRDSELTNVTLEKDLSFDRKLKWTWKMTCAIGLVDRMELSLCISSAYVVLVLRFKTGKNWRDNAIGQRCTSALSWLWTRTMQFFASSGLEIYYSRKLENSTPGEWSGRRAGRWLSLLDSSILLLISFSFEKKPRMHGFSSTARNSISKSSRTVHTEIEQASHSRLAGVYCSWRSCWCRS